MRQTALRCRDGPRGPVRRRRRCQHRIPGAGQSGTRPRLRSGIRLTPRPRLGRAVLRAFPAQPGVVHPADLVRQAGNRPVGRATGGGVHGRLRRGRPGRDGRRRVPAGDPVRGRRRRRDLHLVRIEVPRPHTFDDPVGRACPAPGGRRVCGGVERGVLLVGPGRHRRGVGDGLRYRVDESDTGRGRAVSILVRASRPGGGGPGAGTGTVPALRRDRSSSEAARDPSSDASAPPRRRSVAVGRTLPLRRGAHPGRRSSNYPGSITGPGSATWTRC